MQAGPIQYKRKYTLWVLVVLIIFCWPAAIVYYFTRDKVPVQELQTYAMPVQPAPAYAQSPSQGYAAPPGMAPMSASGAPPAPTAAPAPNCPRCSRPATFVPQYNRYYCYSCAQYV